MTHLQGSDAAKALHDSIKSTHSTLASSHAQLSALQQAYARVAAALGHGLQGLPEGQQGQPAGKRPNKGVSKSKRAALVLDAMQPLLASTLEQVLHGLNSQAPYYDAEGRQQEVLKACRCLTLAACHESYMKRPSSGCFSWLQQLICTLVLPPCL